MNDWRGLEPIITRVTGRSFVVRDAHVVAGGCINRVYRISDGGREYLVKMNSPDALPMFEAEAVGLRELAQADGLRIPAVWWHGVCGDQAMLVLEYVPLRRPGPEAYRQMGVALATLHRLGSPRFGWHRDNFIGRTLQSNQWCDDWVEFLRERRLRPQLSLAAGNGHPHIQSSGERLLEQIGQFFSNHKPVPSLLHGDLWSGNVAADGNGGPVLFDPAVYHGDREADLAMTELFGGFGAEMREAYEAAWPLDPGYRSRKNLYNLYHVLNHLNLFGGAWAEQARHMVSKLLSELQG